MSQTLDAPLTPIHALGRMVLDLMRLVGDITLFGWRMLGWLFAGWPRGNVLWPILDQIGVQSLSVILITGSFIGMVLTVQAYDQFALMGMENQLGTVVNVTLVKELGPVLAALMLAGTPAGQYFVSMNQESLGYVSVGPATFLHRAIMSALAARNADGAMQKMREHFASGLEAAA